MRSFDVEVGAVYLSPVRAYEAGRKTAITSILFVRRLLLLPGYGCGRRSASIENTAEYRAPARARHRRRYSNVCPTLENVSADTRGNIPRRNFRLDRLAFVQSAARGERVPLFRVYIAVVLCTSANDAT